MSTQKIPPPDASNSAPNDVDVVFTDNTTNDASTTKHGFLPKLPNNVRKFLDGLGAWRVLVAADQSDATATPAASKIPIADGSGKLDGWISPATQTTAGIAKRQPITIWSVTANAWTNMPAAKTNYGGFNFARVQFDLSNFTEARISASITIVGAATAKLGVQYSADSGSTWQYLDDTADGSVGSATPQCSLASTGFATSGWMTLAAGARGDVWIRVVGSDGDAVADPVMLTTVQVR